MYERALIQFRLIFVTSKLMKISPVRKSVVFTVPGWYVVYIVVHSRSLPTIVPANEQIYMDMHFRELR